LGNFDSIKRALLYIDSHLDEPMSFDSLAKRFHFSPYYFHRMFSVIVGKTIAAHVRDRRLLRACERLSGTGESVLGIALDCGFSSAQAFSRTFREAYGLPPSEYRRQGLAPVTVTVDEMIMKFTNRLRGGIDVNPKIMKKDALTVAGVSGDGDKTGEAWQAFEQLNSQQAGKLSGNGYEIRVYDGDRCTVHVGFAVNAAPGEPYELCSLPASEYAAFDVYVSRGYESENSAMTEWLRTNGQGYRERLLGDAHYCVEYYDERFNGSEAGSIVEIWIPVEKKP